MIGMVVEVFGEVLSRFVIDLLVVVIILVLNWMIGLFVVFCFMICMCWLVVLRV